MSSSPIDTLREVVISAIGTSITEATIITWQKEVGDAIVEDETICEISSDKVDTDCPSPATGTVAQILVAAGETVEVGTVIARITTSDIPVGVGIVTGPFPDGTIHEGLDVPNTSSVDSPNGSTNGGTHRRPNGAAPRLSPVVARMLAHHQLDTTAVIGTGRNGRITKKDVLALIDRSAASTEVLLHSDSPYRPEPAVQPRAPRPEPTHQVAAALAADELGGVANQLSRMRQTIGARMRASQDTAATCHTIIECDLTVVEHRRRELALTALPIVASATVASLREFPEINATLDGTTITRYERVHLGIAVSLGAEGLIVPVVRDAQDLSVVGLAARIRDLASRARSRDLLPDEVQGATFTITNPGAYGALAATPVIDLPQVGILDLEAIVRRPVVLTVDGQESIAIRSMVNLILGWDHRAIDGVYAAQFLSALKARLERPTWS